jgi:integrase
VAKPYFIFKKSNGYYYAQFPVEASQRTIQKSTGCKDRNTAEKVVLQWYSNGGLPSRINAKKDTEKTSVEKISFFASLRSMKFVDEDIDAILKILKDRQFITSAIRSSTPESKSVVDFLTDFWDFGKSPYIQEKLLRGQSIHKCYCATMMSRVKIYWIPRFSGKTIGCITRNDVRAFFDDAIIKTLAPKTINGIISALTIPMKWAYYNGLSHNNCFDGIVKCTNKGKKRKILTLEQAMAAFKVDWENDSAKLANAVALYTGMRQGEIAGLRIEDIGTDRIYVRHSWSKYEGLKCCKNDEEREVPIASQLRDALLAQAALNPYQEGIAGFIFFGKKPSQPTDPKNWLKYLHRALKAIGYSDPKEICFHSWRHLWCSRVTDLVRDKRIVMLGSGHKTETMLNHYADHIEDSALHALSEAEKSLFLPMLGFTV